MTNGHRRESPVQAVKVVVGVTAGMRGAQASWGARKSRCVRRGGGRPGPASEVAFRAHILVLPLCNFGN